MLSDKQGDIKYHFLSLWFDTNWDWTQVSQAIGEHSNHYATVKKTEFFSSREEAAHWGDTQVATDDILKYINTPAVGLNDQ